MKAKKTLWEISEIIPKMEESQEGLLQGGFVEVMNSMNVNDNTKNAYCSGNSQCTNNSTSCISNGTCDNNQKCSNNKSTCSGNKTCYGYVPSLNLTLNCG